MVKKISVSEKAVSLLVKLVLGFVLAFSFFLLSPPPAKAQAAAAAFCTPGWFPSFGSCCQCVYGNGPGENGPVVCCPPPGGCNSAPSPRDGCKPQCYTNSDCPSGDICVNGSCRSAPPQPTPTPGCTSDADCPNGLVCVSGVCELPPPVDKTPIPPPYVPCKEVRYPEFHSLRPYQASPCNQKASELALYCGNDFILSDALKIEKRYFPLPGIPKDSRLLISRYYFEGEEIAPYCETNEDCGGGSVCINAGCSPAICKDNGDGTETCWFSIDRVKQIAIDLAGAYLPIMGNTENVVNSQEQPSSEEIDDARKVNEYVSWYLNGITGRAEYDPPDPQTEAGKREIIDYSGPLKKLLSWASQAGVRIDEINDAYKSRNPPAFPTPTPAIRHDQIIGCINLLNQPTKCYPDRPGVREIRLTDLRSVLPPLPHKYNDPDEDFIKDYQNWVKNTLADIFQYVPFSSTEDRKGLFQIVTIRVQPVSPDIIIKNVLFSNQKPAELFFAHMQEASELAKLLQQTFAPKDGAINKTKFSAQSVKASNCDLAQVRSNPGDNLFAGEVSGTLSYTAQFACTFNVPGDGRLCTSANGLQGKCVTPGTGELCQTYYGSVDCPDTQFCATGCTNNQGVPLNNNCFTLAPICKFKILGECGLEAGEIRPFQGRCGPAGFPGNCCGPVDSQSQTPDLTETCTVNVPITLNTVTKTPKAKEVWARLVAGPMGVFKRIFPKIQEGAPIERLYDIPAATRVTFKSLDGTPVNAGNPRTGRRGNQAELYFSHIGGVHEYFLKCIQKTLRPKGYADEACASAPPIKPGTCGEALAKLDPPTETTPQASAYFLSFVAPKMTDELLEVYALAEAETGVPCEVLAGIHSIEGNNDPNRSLISGRIIGTPEPDAGGQIFGSLLETAIYAGNHLTGKAGGAIDKWGTLITALSRYNGGGNANCQRGYPWPIPYGNCPSAFEGEDDPYPMNWLDEKHETMYLLYCADNTPCPPQVFLRAGVLSVAVEFFINPIVP